MINIGIFTKGDRILRLIGEELIRERHPDLNIFFVSDPDFLDGDFVVALKREYPETAGGQPVLLTEHPEDEGIFFFQNKERIKEQILESVLGRDGRGGRLGERTRLRRFRILGLADDVGSTVFGHFLARELAGDGRRVCFLSLNPFFPFGCIDAGKRGPGLLKALYYRKNGQQLHPGILQSSPEHQYHVLAMDLNFEEFGELDGALLEESAAMLEADGFDDLVLDYPRAALHLAGASGGRDGIGLVLEPPSGDPLALQTLNGLLQCHPGLKIDARGPGIPWFLKGGRLEIEDGSGEVMTWKKIFRERSWRN